MYGLNNLSLKISITQRHENRSVVKEDDIDYAVTIESNNTAKID